MNCDSAIIRTLRIEDVQAVYALGKDVEEFRCVQGSEHSFWSIETLERFAQDGLSRVVENQGEIVGFAIATYHPITKKMLWENMLLKKEYRGEGMAEKCFGSLWDEAQQRGAEYVHGIVEVGNISSQAMFRRLGFQQGKQYCLMEKWRSHREF